MDPQKPTTFNHKTAKLATGHVYHFVDQFPPDYDPKRTPTLLCVHGFPDLWYGWRYQIGPWVRKGYRVVVPDMLGYGGTDKPTDPSEYSTKKLCADLAALLDHLSIGQAVIVGHDWGAFIVGRFALWHPERLLALIMLSVPYMPPSPVYLPIEEVAKRSPNWGYQVYFADDASTAEIEANLHKFLSLSYRAPGSPIDYTSLGSLRKLLKGSTVQSWGSFLNDDEFQYYHTQLKKGMNGPLNYYRTTKFRYEEEQAAGLPSNLRSNLPVLFMWGTKDATALPLAISKAREFINRLQDIALEGRGHWIMVQAKDDVTENVANWLEGLSARPSRQGKL